MIRKKLLFVIVLFLATFCYAQSTYTINNNKQQYKWFDSIVGQKNSELSLGPKYTNTIRTTKTNHQYFLSKKFLIGNITYNGQEYFDIKMKYDVHFDQIIVQLSNEFEKYSVLLEKSKIQSFSINNKNFINISSKKNTYQFVEELKKGKITLYKKLFKQRYRKTNKRYRYSNLRDENYYIILYQNAFLEIKSKSNLTKQFPNIKKEINQLYKKLNSSKNKDVFMVDLISKIELLISNKM